MAGKPQNRPTVIQPQDTSYRLIALTRGQVCKVDTADYDWLMQWRWQACWMKNTQSFYATRSEYLGDGKSTTKLMSRELLDAPEGVTVDHHNTDTLDNRRFNLRRASVGQNNTNQRRRKDNSTGFKGVHFHKRNGVWTSCIRIKGRQVHLGCFDTPEAAHEVYKLAAVEHFGEFARIA